MKQQSAHEPSRDRSSRGNVVSFQDHAPKGSRSTSGRARVSATVLGADLVHQTRRHRRRKLAWFISLESIALLVLAASLGAGISERFEDDLLTVVFKVLVITAAAAVGLIPILFYGPARTKHYIRRNSKE